MLRLPTRPPGPHPFNKMWRETKVLLRSTSRLDENEFTLVLGKILYFR
jgi:hypothetical protein